MKGLDKSVIFIICIIILLSGILPSTLANSYIKNLKSSSESDLIEFKEGEVIVGFKERIDSLKGASFVKKFGAESIIKSQEKLNSILVKVEEGNELEFIERIEKDPSVKYAELNGYMYSDDKTPNDPSWDLQWGPKAINCGTAWEENTIGSKDVVICIMDSGIDYNHEDLKDSYLDIGYDWVNNDNDPKDDFGHGTHCAGVAAATMDNEKGIAGVAQVSIMSEKTLNFFGKGNFENTANAIIHATDVGADIISMSFGSLSGSNLVTDACQYAWENNVVLVASSGNENGDVKYPACLDTVIAVGAVDFSLSKSSYSNYGPELELMAPGDTILSTYLFNSYFCLSGTSMACPHVAGVAALLKSMGHKSNSEIRNILRDKAIDLGDEGWDQFYGYGLVDASLKGEKANSMIKAIPAKYSRINNLIQLFFLDFIEKLNSFYSTHWS